MPTSNKAALRAPEQEELECAWRGNKETTQAGSAARPQENTDDDESKQRH